MQLGRTYIYSNFLKAIMIFATMLLAVGVALIIFCRDGDMDSRGQQPASQQSAARDCVSRIRQPVCYERAAAADTPAVRGGRSPG